MSGRLVFQRLRSELRRERDHLDRIMGEVAEALALVARRPPTGLELRGLACLVNDYYSGLEKAFRLVATTLDGGLPEGARWHRRLLDAMTLELEEVRPALLSSATAGRLDEFLRFRHLFRSIYGHELDWGRVAPLLGALAAVDALVAADLTRFEGFLTSVAR